MNIYAKLLKVQTELKAPKNKYSKYGDYNYRSCEGILEGAKPLLKEVGALLLLSDRVEELAGRWYVVASAAFVDAETGERVEVEARARETQARPKFDDAQLTGAASSYARKYALSGLLGVDDGADVDALPIENSGGRSAGGQKSGGQSKAPASRAIPSSKPKQEQRQAGGDGAQGTELINAIQCQLLEKAAEKKGVTLESILQRFNISGLGQLLEKDYRVIMGELQRKGAGGEAAGGGK